MISKVTSIETVPKINLPVDAWKLFSSERVELIHITLKPNEFVEKHINPLDVVFYILSGTGKIDLEEEAIQLAQGECIPVEKNKQRGWFNNSTTQLQLLVIKML
jgi:quercetin dioxygenase-like cupin family protein